MGENMPNYYMTVYWPFFSDDPIFVLHIQIMYQTSGKRVSAQWKPRTRPVPIPQKVTLFHFKIDLNTNDNKVSGQFNLLCFWITHNHIFTANVKSQKVLFSIGPPTLMLLICWEKKTFLDPRNISKYQGQQSRRPVQYVMFFR